MSYKCKLHKIYYYDCPICCPLRTTIQPREDLLMLTNDKYPGEFCPRTNAEETRGAIVAKVYGGPLGKAYIGIGRGWENPKEGHKAFLISQKHFWVDSNLNERMSMMGAVAWCPRDAKRIFVGGLGLGLILLYLAKFLKKRSINAKVTVVELDPLIIKLIEPLIRPWFTKHYPEFQFEIIHGNAIELVKQGLAYDWIFMDIWSHASDPESKRVLLASKEAALQNVSPTGRVTCWLEARVMNGGMKPISKKKLAEFSAGFPKLDELLSPKVTV